MTLLDKLLNPVAPSDTAGQVYTTVNVSGVKTAVWAAPSSALPTGTAGQFLVEKPDASGGVFLSPTAGDGTAWTSDGTTIRVDFSLFGQARGAIPYRGASGWAALAPGTVGQLMQSGGAGANPLWVNNPIPTGLSTGDMLYQASTGALARVPFGSSGTYLRCGGGNVPIWSTLVAGNGLATSSTGTSDTFFLSFAGQAQGAIVYRDASAYAVLAPGTAGQVLQSGGASANPSWATRTQPQSTTPAAVAASGATGSGTTYARDDHAHAGVATVNTLTGAITIAAGTNISLGTVGNTLTVNSTAASTATGTGFAHYTSGVADAAAKLVFDADVDAAAAIAITKLAGGTAAQMMVTVGTTPTWLSPVVGDGAQFLFSSTTVYPNVYVAGQANGDHLVRVGGAWVREPGPTQVGQSLRSAGAGAAGVWGVNGGIVETAAISASTTGGADVTATFYTTPASPTKIILTAVVAKITTALVGAGSVTMTVGATVGGTEYMKSYSITSSDAVGDIIGLSVGSEAGTSFVYDLGSAVKMAFNAPVIYNLSTVGTVTTAPAVKFTVIGWVFA